MRQWLWHLSHSPHLWLVQLCTPHQPQGVQAPPIQRLPCQWWQAFAQWCHHLIPVCQHIPLPSLSFLCCLYLMTHDITPPSIGNSLGKLLIARMNVDMIIYVVVCFGCLSFGRGKEGRAILWIGLDFCMRFFWQCIYTYIGICQYIFTYVCAVWMYLWNVMIRGMWLKFCTIL